MFGGSAIFLVFFWITAGFFLVADVTGHPTWIMKYKTQPGKNEPVEKDKLWKAFKTVIFNQLILGIPLLSLYSYAKVKIGSPYSSEDLPSVFRIVCELTVITVIEEIGFYYTHRLVHWGPLYKWIHKQHHEWTAPIALIAFYAHPIEYVVSNSVPVMTGPIVLKSHILTAWIWYALAVMTTAIHHSGYHLPWLPSPQFHDFHHLKFNCNYGLLGILDWFHGTDKLWRGTVEFKRHRLCAGLTPINQIYKD